MRRILVNAVGLPTAADECGQGQQVGHPKGGAARGQDHERVWPHDAGPGSRQRTQFACAVPVPDPVLAPGGADGQELKLLAAQGMEGMGDPENSSLSAGTGCR